MASWRVFWYLGAAQPDRLGGSLIALDSRTLIAEGQAKFLVQELLKVGIVEVSLRRPDSGKIVKGAELRHWLGPTG
jgi:hypothetical protein